MIGKSSNASLLQVRPAEEKDLQELANLVHFEVHVHRHLDWRPPLEWLGYAPFFVAEQKGNVVAALACPPDPASVAWLRLFAVASGVSLKKAWESLWPEACAQLVTFEKLRWAAAIPLHPWLIVLLESSGFLEIHRVVVLSREMSSLPGDPSPSDIVIRPMTIDDLPAVSAVDQAAFVPIWQNSQSSLELAYHQAMIASVAEIKHRLVAYQISTPTPLGGHLARLAVLPDFQRRGIGSAVLHDLLQKFECYGAAKVTVNTQHDNAASLSMYQKAGFHLTGEELPVFQLSYPVMG